MENAHTDPSPPIAPVRPGADFERVMIAGDCHGNTRHVFYLIQQARLHHAQALFVLGDFGFWEHTPDGVEFLNAIDEQAGARGIPIFFLDGNHDNMALLLELYPSGEDGWVKVRANVSYSPRGHRFRWGTTDFISLGGAYSVDKAYRLDVEAKKRRKIIYQNSFRRAHQRRSEDTAGTMWFPEEEMTDLELATILGADTSPVHVILAHDKPFGSRPSRNFKNLPECAVNQRRLQLAARVLTPTLFMHGHLHWRYSDRIVIGDDQRSCQVEGLSCDPSGFNGVGYMSADSWLLLDVRDGPHILDPEEDR